MNEYYYSQPFADGMKPFVEGNVFLRSEASILSFGLSIVLI